MENPKRQNRFASFELKKISGIGSLLSSPTQLKRISSDFSTPPPTKKSRQKSPAPMANLRHSLLVKKDDDSGHGADVKKAKPSRSSGRGHYVPPYPSPLSGISHDDVFGSPNSSPSRLVIQTKVGGPLLMNFRFKCWLTFEFRVIQHSFSHLKGKKCITISESFETFHKVRDISKIFETNLTSPNHPPPHNNCEILLWNFRLQAIEAKIFVLNFLLKTVLRLCS